MAMGHDDHGAVRTRHPAVAGLRSRRYKELTADGSLPSNIAPNATASMCSNGDNYVHFVLHTLRHPELRKLQIRIGEGTGWKLGWGIEQAAGREWLWQ